MRRALLAAGLLAAIAVAAAAPCAAQTVAKLEVVKGSKDSRTLHQKLDRVLEILEGTTKPPPPPPPPVEPKPVDPAPPADNPFTAWCASGSTVLEYVLLRNGGIWLSPAQEAQARAAGCFAPPTPPASGGGAPGASTGPGFDLGEGDGLVKVNPVQAGQSLTFTFTRRASGHARIAVFGAPGAFFRVVTDAVNGADEVTIAGSGQLHERDVTALPAGHHTYTVRVDGAGQLGVQFSQ